MHVQFSASLKHLKVIPPSFLPHEYTVQVNIDFQLIHIRFVANLKQLFVSLPSFLPHDKPGRPWGVVVAVKPHLANRLAC